MCIRDSAYEVSGDLKYALRRSIELLGNEVVAFIKGQKKGVFEERLDPEQLTLELLRFMYRLLFLFFIESRHQELGYAPMGNDVFRLGYSLESLRDLDTAELASEEDREGTYISESLDRLFDPLARRSNRTSTRGHAPVPLQSRAAVGCHPPPARLRAQQPLDPSWDGVGVVEC